MLECPSLGLQEGCCRVRHHPQFNHMQWKILALPLMSLFYVVQSLSPVWLLATPCIPGSLSFTISRNLLKFMPLESGMLPNHLILCHLLLLVPSIFLSIGVFSYESALRIRWAKYTSFTFSTSPSNEYSGLISFRIDWFYLPASKAILSFY